MSNSADVIINSLYERYFQQNQPSSITSSHWKEVGSHEVKKTSGKLVLTGKGFGTFRENSLLNKIRFVPEIILTRWLEVKYEANAELLKIAKDLCANTFHLFDYDCLRQVLSAEKISNLISPDSLKTVCVIGDGYGFMGSLLKARWPHLKILSINLGKTLLFDAYYTSQAFPNLSHKYIGEYEKTIGEDFNYLEAENFHLLKEMQIDLFINIASMQEMDNKVINSYFSFMTQTPTESRYFYCCNRIEKKLPDGEITRIDEYPWRGWSIKLNELCPWYQTFPIHRPPFWMKFDGPIKHVFAAYSKKVL